MYISTGRIFTRAWLHKVTYCPQLLPVFREVFLRAIMENTLPVRKTEKTAAQNPTLS